MDTKKHCSYNLSRIFISYLFPLLVIALSSVAILFLRLSEHSSSHPHLKITHSQPPSASESMMKQVSPLMMNPISSTVIHEGSTEAAAMENASSFPGYHSQSLSHVVMPFHSSQLSLVEKNLRQWSNFLPCNPKTIFANRITFIFYTSMNCNSLPRACVGMERLINELWMSLGPSVTYPCFAGGYQIIHGDLIGKNDTYLSGSRLMFEKLFNGNTQELRIKDKLQYIFYMEPDARPVQQYWLNELLLQTRWPVPLFWMKGSIFRGSNVRVAESERQDSMFHINGNAIYNMQSKAFRNMYFKKVKPFIEAIDKAENAAFNNRIRVVRGTAETAKKVQPDDESDNVTIVSTIYRDQTVNEYLLMHHQERNAYDTSIYRYLLHPNNYNYYRTVAHNFIYSDFIQNYWNSKLSTDLQSFIKKNPRTFFIHGPFDDEAVDAEGKGHGHDIKASSNEKQQQQQQMTMNTNPTEGEGVHYIDIIV